MNKMRYFKYSEFIVSATARKMGINNNFPNDVVKRNINLLVINILDVCRSYIGEPIYVTSGYRCPLLNRAVGGAKNSQHMQGKAADITTLSRKSNMEIFDFIIEMGDFDQLIEYHNYSFIHVSFDWDKYLNHTLRKQVLHVK